ncbi:hypothetical protein OPT61_g3249 [Boeremia exigua]|uniref:Uncharacterized protein n=1 Tax=Boeremia exigua TaxID=749465 RepID=A0ACC2IIE8_9PLEO|nr:hypothetical protein OPT61_g3249 [Boeremia exigua]
MSAPESNTLLRFAKLFKGKRGSGRRSKIVKKTTSGAHIKNDHDVARHASICEVTNNDTISPCGYYTPRPFPKSFVVGRVRKMSGNGGSSRLIVKSGAASNYTDSEPASVPKTTKTEPGDSHKLPTHVSGSSFNRRTGRIRSSSTNVGASTEKPLIDEENRSNEGKHPRPSLSLLLGLQNPHSPYFARRLFSLPDLTDMRGVFEASDNTLYHISELDPQAFEVYRTYVHTGRIGFRPPTNVKAEHVWIACWPLMNAHILGCVVEEVDFADKVMDTLVERLTTSVRPDVETVKHLFDNDKKEIPEALKKLIVNRFIAAQQRSFAPLETLAYPLTFKLSILEAALTHLSRNHSTAAMSGCEYHVHSKTEACYRTKRTLIDVSKDRRLAEAREISARDAEMVSANILNNGVKSIDWEQRRADANKVLRAETGKLWVGFRRLQGGKLKDQREPGPKMDVGTSPIDFGPDCATVEIRDSPTMNGATENCNLTKDPTALSALQNGILKASPIVCSVPSLQTNNNAVFRPKTSPIKPLGQYLQPLIPAELDGSTVVDKCPTASFASSYKPSVDRPSRSESTKTDCVHGEDDVGLSSHTYSDDAQALSSTRGSDLNYERFFTCPGAYPESDVSFLDDGKATI